MLAAEYAPDAAVNQRRSQEHISSEIIDNFISSTNTKVTDSCKHRYGIVDVYCLFDSGAQMRIVSWYSPVASPLG